MRLPRASVCLHTVPRHRLAEVTHESICVMSAVGVGCGIQGCHHSVIVLAYFGHYVMYQTGPEG